jgi:hypothetical protein
MHSCGETAIKGWSWSNFWANLASFLLVDASTLGGSAGSVHRPFYNTLSRCVFGVGLRQCTWLAASAS